MTVLDPPRHPIVVRALGLAKTWCTGQVIDDAPALRHAVLVARTLVRHVPDAAPQLVAAALLHDGEDFAPPGIDLDAALDDQVSSGVAPIVRALAAQHRAMDAGDPPVLGDAQLTVVAGADKIVAFRSLMRRAKQSSDPPAFWGRRDALRSLLPYFQGWCQLHAPLMPASMTAQLRMALTALTQAVTSPAPPESGGPAASARPGRLPPSARPPPDPTLVASHPPATARRPGTTTCTPDRRPEETR